MARFVTLLLLAALAVAEVGVVVFLVDALGPTTALAVLALDVLAGLFVMRWGMRGPREERGWRLAAGAVIAVPGIVLDLVGIALLVPGVREALRRSVWRGTESAMRRRGMSVVTVTDPTGTPRRTVVPGEVIPGAVVDPEEPGSPSGPGGGRVVRGEVAGPEES